MLEKALAQRKTRVPKYYQVIAKSVPQYLLGAWIGLLIVLEHLEQKLLYKSLRLAPLSSQYISGTNEEDQWRLLGKKKKCRATEELHKI